MIDRCAHFPGRDGAGAGGCGGGQARAHRQGVPICPATGRPIRERGGIGQSLSISDIGGRKRGQEDDIPYQPWAREKTMAEKPSTGPNPIFRRDDGSAGPLLRAAGRAAHLHVADQDEVLPTPEAVYILYELRALLSGRLAERQASRGSGSAVVGPLDRIVRKRRHAGRGHGRVQRQDVAGSDGRIRTRNSCT